MQITDTLAAGGLERVAVNLANHLPREPFQSHLCVTRESGPLSELLSEDVKQLHLMRKGRADLRAVFRLVAYIRENKIRILHAHGTSVFIAVAAARFRPHPAVVWHYHFGRSATERAAWIYRFIAKAVGGIITVNQALADWSRDQLLIPPERIWSIPNFVCVPATVPDPPDLPGQRGTRIICVANLRPVKDQLNLLGAMKWVVREKPDAHLLLVGNGDNQIFQEKVLRTINEEGLKAHVTWLGPRNDVPVVLRHCDVGVLSSASEGAPLALIEYGMAGLAVVATNVGQCAEVLDEGRVGMLVPPKASRPLAEAILSLLREPEKRAELAAKFRERVRNEYSVECIMKRICHVYETVLNNPLKNQEI